MLFLVKSEAKVPPTMPMEEVAPKLRESWEMLARLEKEHKILGGGRIAGTRSAYFVVDVDSADELDRIFASSPLYGYLELQILPLTSIRSALEQVKDWERREMPGGIHGGKQGGSRGQWPVT